VAASRGLTVLRVNLDETSVCLYPGSARGSVFVSRKRMRDGNGRVAKWKRRCCLTHVGLICDRPGLQPHLPQFIVGNERTFAARQLAALRSSAPANVTLVRQKSAWSNGQLTGTIIRELARRVRGMEAAHGKLQIILVLDAARIHFTPHVLRACKASSVWLVLVPAKMTCLLQPLDTHAFSLYKGELRRAYQAARSTSASADGDLELSEFLPCVYLAIRRVLQGRRWDIAFLRDGFGAQQAGVSARVRQRLELVGDARAPATRPTDEQVRACLPRRSLLRPSMFWALYALPEARPVALRLLPARRVAAARPRGRAPAVATTASAAVSAAPMRAAASLEGPVAYGRTRSETLRLKAGSALLRR
jgi:hypothetical protein